MEQPTKKLPERVMRFPSLEVIMVMGLDAWFNNSTALVHPRLIAAVAWPKSKLRALRLHNTLNKGRLT